MKKILICVLATLLSGCFLGRSQPAKIYSLNTISGTEKVENTASSIQVVGVHLPKYMDRPQMVVKEQGATDVKILEKNRWAEPLSDLMPRILSDDLSYTFPNGIIKQKTISGEKFDYMISVDLTQLDIVMNDKINMLGWWVLRKSNGTVVVREKIDLSLPITNSYTDIALKQSELMRQLADQIARRLKQIKK